MVNFRLVLAGVAGLGLFASGYLVGRLNVGESAEFSRSSSHTVRSPNRKDPLASTHEFTKAKLAQRLADEKNTGYRRTVDMVSEGKIRIDGVQINSETFLPGDKVGEFFGLSSEQLAEMKQLGLERLRKKQDREQSLATIHEVSESGIVFDVPADPEFATAETAEFVEDLSRAFGPDVAAMLQPSVGQAYGESDAPRHVRYSLTRREDAANLPDDAPAEIRSMYEGTRDFKVGVNQNEDGSYMKDEQGMTLRNAGSSAGTVNLNDTSPESYRPHYHYLWERKMNHH